MRAYVGVTDRKWFDRLRSLPHVDEVNFWQPSGKSEFKALKPGELFLFKLHSPDNCIVGGGVFLYSGLLPISRAWELFGESNGAPNLSEMRRNIAGFRRQFEDRKEDYTIGCILIEEPIFLPESLWIPQPSDWSPSIVQGKGYDLSVEPGLSLWKQLQVAMPVASAMSDSTTRYGHPSLVMPRLGQGAFRILVTEAYDRRCAVTNERTLPALDAAHIMPYAEHGEHVIPNGVLLRRDLHALFDKGYVTIMPSMSLEVSRKIREEFENGKDYYKLQGAPVRLPANPIDRPSLKYLEWHNLNIYRG